MRATIFAAAFAALAAPALADVPIPRERPDRTPPPPPPTSETNRKPPPMPYSVSRCAPRERWVDTLTDRYGEERRAVALDARGQLVELWGASDGAWTVLLTTPAGQSCLVGAGEAHEIIPQGVRT